jgi:diguanylate cyclase (GGDEF)-like protein
MALVQRLMRGVLRCSALLLVLLLANPAQAQLLGLESLCNRDELFVDGRLTEASWEPVNSSVVRVPIHKTCWLRATRPAAANVSGAMNNQFLRIENSWGSNFALYAPSGELLAKSTVSGERFRTIVDKGWIHVQLQADSPPVLYVRVESLNHFSTVRHRIEQLDGDAIVMKQKRQLQDAATGWLLFSAAVFSALFYVVQRNRDYALFSCFALVFSLTLFSDRGELASLGLTSSTDLLSLAYPLSGLVLAWLTLRVGRLALYTPWVARALMLVICLYGALAGWQILMMLGAALSADMFESFADYVYNAAALLQVFVFWGGFQAWRRGDKAAMLIAVGIAPLVLFEVQISDWFVASAPALAASVKSLLGSSLRSTSYLLLPVMFFSAIAYRAQSVQRDAMRLAQRDQLTNLPNRDYFLRVGQIKLDANQGAILLAINIDRLKAINEVLGFQVGDAVIAKVGQRLADLGDGLVARVQTSQFCLLLLRADQLQQVRRRIEAAFTEPLLVLGQTLDVSLSVGLALHQGESMSTLLRDADIALGVAKTTKLSWLAYERAMDTTRPESLSLLSELNRAIEENELRLFLQPKVQLSDGRITGAEGLVRWQHPTRGMVQPNDFIPFAEQTGKISALTLWVIREGAVLTARYRQEGRPLVLSVNISTNDLREPNFAERVLALVREQGAWPGDLRMEVTESAMMENPQASLVVLHALRDAGFSLAIDDFGTGYSSLSYLQKMPMTELKIDRSFVRHVRAGSEGAELLDSIIALGHRMGLRVVGEGAETALEWALLQSLGCDFIQGWFVAKAMPATEFAQWRLLNDPFVREAASEQLELA